MFKFLEYIQPGWYYLKNKEITFPVFAQKELLLQDKYTQLIDFHPYKEEKSRTIDALYQLLSKGFIPENNQTFEPLQKEWINNVKDNYHFIKRFFGLGKCVYILLLRLFTLKNPLREISGFLSCLKVSKVNLYDKIVHYSDFSTFESQLIKENPLVSVIIPTLNRYEYLKDVLTDLENQTYKNFEVLVCDQSEPINKEFYQNWKLDLKLLEQQEKALWLARNRCIKDSKGEYILLFDDDSRVEPDWIENHLKSVDYFKNGISAGVTHTLVGGGLSKRDKYFHLSSVFDTGNALVKKEIFKTTGLFDRQFEKQRMGDGEFGIRSILKGQKVISNPYASRIHLKVETGGLRQMGSWDALRPKSLLAPRPVPSVLYLYRKYFGNKQALKYIFQSVPVSFIPYQFKSNKKLKLFFWCITPLLLPLMSFVVLKSWNEASEKLKQGDKIEYL